MFNSIAYDQNIETWNFLALVIFTQCAIWRLAFQSLILQNLQVKPN